METYNLMHAIQIMVKLQDFLFRMVIEIKLKFMEKTLEIKGKKCMMPGFADIVWCYRTNSDG